MAIYKPNNFYPYMQEVDLESDEGVIFSCQANTDGGSMVRAARLRILNKDKNIVLYEKIQNLNNPIKNGEIVEFKVEPYIFDSNNLINFISLTPDININERINYCPYNFYQDQIYGFNDFIISLKTEIEGKYFWNSFSNYNVQINNNEYFLIDKNSKERILGDIKITLKNNKEYIWEIDLFEHEINSTDFKGTYVGNGTITGSTGPILWIDKNNQDEQVKNEFSEIKKDQYVEYNLNEFNSDVYKEKINEGFSLSGQLNVEMFENNQLDFKDYQDGNFYSTNTINALYAGNTTYYSGDMGFMPVKYGSYYYRIKLNVKDYSPLYFGDFYNLSDNKRILNSDGLHIDNDLTGYIMGDRPQYNDTSSSSHHVKIVDYDPIVFDHSPTPQECIDTFISNQWRYIYNVDFEIQDISNDEDFYNEGKKLILNITDETYVGTDINDCCLKLIYYVRNSLYRGTSVQKNYEDDLYQPIMTKDGTTTIVANNRQLTADTPNAVLKKSRNSEGEMYALKNEEIYQINGELYRTRILTPLPYSPSWCVLNSWKQHESDPTRYYMSVPNPNEYYKGYDFSHLLSYKNMVDESGNSIVDENNVQIKEINSDYYCYINHVPNCLERVYLRPVVSDYYMAKKNEISDENLDLHNKYDLYMKDTEDIEKVTQIFNVSSGNIYTLTIETNGLKIDTKSISLILSDEESFVEDVISVNFLNLFNEYSQQIEVPYYLKKPQIKIKFLKEQSKIINVKLSSFNSLGKTQLKISDNTILDLSSENLYLNVSKSPDIIFNGFNYDDFESYKIKNIINNFITLEDLNKQNELIELVNSETYYYFLSYKYREKITWVSDNLGNLKNIFKIETENNSIYSLNNNAEIQIYENDNEYTNNSFFGVKDSDLNVDNIYIRFPGYVGEDINGNYINDIVPYISGTSALPSDYAGKQTPGINVNLM